MAAWWGDHFHPLCRETSDINTIVCQPAADDEDTMIASQATGWITYLLKRQVCHVADMFSTSGKYKNICIICSFLILIIFYR